MHLISNIILQMRKYFITQVSRIDTYINIIMDYNRRTNKNEACIEMAKKLFEKKKTTTIDNENKNGYWLQRKKRDKRKCEDEINFR